MRHNYPFRTLPHIFWQIAALFLGCCFLAAILLLCKLVSCRLTWATTQANILVADHWCILWGIAFEYIYIYIWNLGCWVYLCCFSSYLIQCAEINCFRLPSPHHLYSHLLRSLTGEWLGSTTAHRKLLQIFSSNNESINTKRLPVLLVADELDAIVTKDQKVGVSLCALTLTNHEVGGLTDHNAICSKLCLHELSQVLYNLSEWCSSKHSKLAMIGIANTIDLPERLHPKIKR